MPAHIREMQRQVMEDAVNAPLSQVCDQALAELKAAAQGDDNLMYPILKAVKALATLGEICDGLRSVFGEYESAVKV